MHNLGCPVLESSPGTAGGRTIAEYGFEVYIKAMLRTKADWDPDDSKCGWIDDTDQMSSVD